MGLIAPVPSLTKVSAPCSKPPKATITLLPFEPDERAGVEKSHHGKFCRHCVILGVLATLILTLLVSILPRRENVDHKYSAALSACKSGDYETAYALLQWEIGAALRLFRPLAEHGDPNAQYYVGLIKDDDEAPAWFRKAAEQGHTKAMVELARVCQLRENDTEAANWLRKAAEQGDPVAQLELGTCYAKGVGVKLDNTEAAILYRRSADQGYAAAQRKLGRAYESGQGLQQSSIDAVSWYRKAAEQGDAQAQFELGSMYRNGHGVNQDHAEAAKWFLEAASKWCFRPAEESLAAMLRDGTLHEATKEMVPEKIKEAQWLALKWKPNQLSNLMEWKEIADAFKWDGSWRDIYVLWTTEADWDSALAQLHQCDPPPIYDVDGVEQAMPAHVADVFSIIVESSPTLDVTVGGTTLRCHFFQRHEIDFHFDPRDITGLPQAHALADFMQLLGETTGRSVILCHENAKDAVIARYSPSIDRVVWFDLSSS
jgi:TPR repeat protein